MLFAAGGARAEPVSDLHAFHAGWVVAHHGMAVGEPAMIAGGLEVFSAIAPRTEDPLQNATPLTSGTLEAWSAHRRTLAAEVVFLARDAPVALPEHAPGRFLPAAVYTVAPSQVLETDMPGIGDRAVLVLDGGDVEISLSDATGTKLCATTGPAILCAPSWQSDIHARLLNTGGTTATVLLLGEPN